MHRIKWLSLALLLVAMGIFAHYHWTVLRNRDNAGPVIRMEQQTLSLSVTDGEEALLEGVYAQDERDGDVTGSVVVESVSEFVGEGTRYVNYAAFDSDHHVSKASRKLVYTDYVPTQFSLDEPLRFPMTAGNLDLLSRVHAFDCLDGDISERINFSNGTSIDPGRAADYPARLEVTNSAGDTQTLDVTVTIYDPGKEGAAPTLELTDSLVYTTRNHPLKPETFLSKVIYQGVTYGLTNERGTFGVRTDGMDEEELDAFQTQSEEYPSVSLSRIRITDRVDYETPGCYEIQYQLEDEQGNQGKVNLIVVVQEG